MAPIARLYTSAFPAAPRHVLQRPADAARLRDDPARGGARAAVRVPARVLGRRRAARLLRAVPGAAVQLDLQREVLARDRRAAARRRRRHAAVRGGDGVPRAAAVPDRAGAVRELRADRVPLQLVCRARARAVAVRRARRRAAGADPRGVHSAREPDRRDHARAAREVEPRARTRHQPADRVHAGRPGRAASRGWSCRPSRRAS